MTTDPDHLGVALVDLASAQVHDQTLVELETAAEARGEPLPDRASATFVAWALRAVGARRVVELGAGAGGLTWWLAGAVGEAGALTAITDAASGQRLVDRLRRAGRSRQVTVLTTESADAGASPAHLDAIDGELDAVVVAAVTAELTADWSSLVRRVRSGGAIVVGGVLDEPGPTGSAARLTREALEDPELWTTVVPLGGGWLAALKGRSDLAGAATDRLWEVRWRPARRRDRRPARPPRR